jgi:hypothetical protein
MHVSANLYRLAFYVQSLRTSYALYALPSPNMLTYSRLTEVAFGKEQLNIFVFDFCMQSLAKECCVCIELISYRLLHCLYQLILQEGVRSRLARRDRHAHLRNLTCSCWDMVSRIDCERITRKWVVVLKNVKRELTQDTG